jgi:DNA-binding NarL/FixJ family response regulator
MLPNVITNLESNMKNTIDLMIVDDNFRARQALMAYLSLQSGIRVIAQAANGSEAINNLRNHTPDIILMDMQMPVMDGLEATRIIKKHWPKIKIIILTMYPNYQPETLSAGVEAFLIKGSPIKELVATFRGLMLAEAAVSPPAA